ncbi:MAG: hypothetical protein ACWA5P_03580 [bacterium]
MRFKFCSLLMLLLLISCSSGDDSPNNMPPEENVANVPVVSTVAISNISETTADSGGNVTDDGGANVTARGVCWSTSQNPTLEDNTSNNGVGEGTFTSQITGLSENTQYYVRAYATNSEGTAYGQQQTFTTLPEELACGSVFNGSIELTSQNDIDDFVLNNYTEITGDLVLDEFLAGNPPIIDLSGFNCLTTIGGKLEIQDVNLLTSLEGFENLQSVSSIILGMNASLESISQLTNITQLEEGLIIRYNPSLTDLSGLDNLISTSRLAIIQTPIISLNGLNSLEIIDEYFEISDCDELTALDGLESLSIVNNLVFLGNNILENLDALSNLDSLNGSLSLSTCPSISSLLPFNDVNLNINELEIRNLTSLENLNGLNGITNLSNGLRIESNNVLENIDAINGLSGDIQEVNLTFNPVLSNISFNEIQSIDNSLVISNVELNTLDFQNLQNVGETLRIEGGNQLEVINFPLLNTVSRVDISGLNLNQIVFGSLNNITFGLIIENCEQLTSLEGFSNLTSIGDDGFLLTNLEALTDLDGLLHLSTVDGDINIDNNGALSDFCGLQPLLLNNGFNGSSFLILNNAYNPTQQEIIDGNCSQ